MSTPSKPTPNSEKSRSPSGFSAFDECEAEAICPRELGAAGGERPPISDSDFRRALDEVLHGQQLDEGVGVLAERTLHAVLKRCYEPYEGSREVKLGRFVADIFSEDGVIEIQTGGFYPLKKKLAEFLELTPVTIVHPIVRRRRLFWVDAATGETSDPKRSPRVGSLVEVFGELRWISEFLTHANLRIHLLLVDVDEYRIALGKRKNGATRRGDRLDRIPTALIEQFRLERPEDYAQLCPPDLPETFGSAEFAASAKVHRSVAQAAVRLLTDLGVLERLDGKPPYSYKFKF